MVEVAGVEPASQEFLDAISTGLESYLVFARKARRFTLLWG